jgi:NitT/TauT family transport system ATP-binding protein
MGPTVLIVKGLHHAYARAQVAIADLTFDVNAGEIVSIVGPSGCGKTTLLKALAGLLQPTEGTIQFQGEAVQGVPGRRWCSRNTAARFCPG